MQRSDIFQCLQIIFSPFSVTLKILNRFKSSFYSTNANYVIIGFVFKVNNDKLIFDLLIDLKT